jgi:hypothetical protein
MRGGLAQSSSSRRIQAGWALLSCSSRRIQAGWALLRPRVAVQGGFKLAGLFSVAVQGGFKLAGLFSQ